VLSEPESRHVYDYEGFSGLAEIQKKNKERGSGFLHLIFFLLKNRDFRSDRREQRAEGKTKHHNMTQQQSIRHICA
jgi:hypothetical protein